MKKLFILLTIALMFNGCNLIQKFQEKQILSPEPTMQNLTPPTQDSQTEINNKPEPKESVYKEVEESEKTAQIAETFFTPAEKMANCKLKVISNEGENDNLYRVQCGFQNKDYSYGTYVTVPGDGSREKYNHHYEFYLYKNGLFYGDSNIAAQVSELLGTQYTADDDTEVSIWHRRVDGDNLYLYFSSGAGCGGCVWSYSKYLRVDMKTLAVTQLTLKNKSRGNKEFTFEKNEVDTPRLWNAFFSPDGNVVAYVIINNEDTTVDQTVYTFDLRTETEKKILDVPKNKTVVEAGMGYYFKENLMSWDANNNITIKLLDRNKDGSIR